MDFRKRKAATMTSISSTTPDKSPKGTIDTPIVPLLSLINSHPSYFTTSSCSGRISIFSHQPNRSKGGSWAFISHQPISPSAVLDLLLPTHPPNRSNSAESTHSESFELSLQSDPPVTPVGFQDVGSAQFSGLNPVKSGFKGSKTSNGTDSDESTHPESGDLARRSYPPVTLVGFQDVGSNQFSYSDPVKSGFRGSKPSDDTDSAESTQTDVDDLVFRFEPLIIAVECKDVGSAQFLVSAAIRCGFRESGITSVSEKKKRVIVGVRCSVRLEVPLGRRENVRVSREYLRYLVEVANEKMGENWRRLRRFEEELRRIGFVGPEGVDCVWSEVLRSGIDGGGEEDEEKDEEEGDQCVGGGNQETSSSENDSGPSGSSRCGLAIVLFKTVGEPGEKLFLWGHSSCTTCNGDRKDILIYGGFGGIGRHARRNDCLLFDPSSGKLSTVDVRGSPSARLGHTSSIVGDLMVVIGGRAGPANILDELWIFNFTKSEWKSVANSGNVFAPRHRHAAAVVGSKIYVFGGLNNSKVHSSLLMLDVATLQWTDVHASGEQPSARHSHSLVAYGDTLYLFGGYNGERVLGDLYSFDVKKYKWEKVLTIGKAAYPRFSHVMFVYKNYLGIIGGCPVKQHCQELSLLNLKTFVWKHVILDSVDKELFVRSTANIVGDDLIIIGGGASCYAFGTKFSEPAKINLLPLLNILDTNVPSSVNGKHRMHQNGKSQSSQLANRLVLDGKESGGIGSAAEISYWVLKLEKKFAKLGKDILKKFGWLDLGRKVYSSEDGSSICFPVTQRFCTTFSDELCQTTITLEGLSHLNLSKTSLDSCSTALELLVAIGARKHIDEFVAMKKSPVTPMEAMKEVVHLVLKQKGLSDGLLEQLPTRWERLGDIVVLPVTSFTDPVWDTIGNDLWNAVAKALGARRLARQGRVASTGTRDSRLEMLVGDNGWVEHRENGILYCFDAAKCMFSWGNLSEKLRMARLDCRDEVIVDLFAGIGYFTLPFLVRAHAKVVYACEWNSHAVEALKRNLQANLVYDRCIVLEGDNRLTAPEGIADRVCLGLLPSSEGSWITAVKALRSEGGTLHIHGNVKDSEESEWAQNVVRSISKIAETEGRSWDVLLLHVERVKWYAPHIRHLVADVRCQLIQTVSK